MLERLIRFAIEHRMLIVLLTMAAAGLGVYTLQRLPIDAVPDITNKQVQINTEAAALSPVEIEKQVTFPIETALAGIPGLEYTRSLSRNGFSQVTAVFRDHMDIYFARQQVNERLTEARESLPPGAEPIMGPISTGLGEVYMWTVEYASPRTVTATAGAPGWQPNDTYLTPEGQRLTNELERLTYLRTVQDWIIRPQLKNVEGVAGVDSMGGYVKQYHVQPDPMRLVAYGLTFQEVIEALERNNVSTGAGYIEHKGEAYIVRAEGRITNEEQIASIVVGTRQNTPIYIRDIATVGLGRELRTGGATENGAEVVVGTALMLLGDNSRRVAAAVDAKMPDMRKTLPPHIQAKTVLNRSKLVNATIHTVQKNLAEGALLVIVVLFLLLGNLRAALITALAIPLSMLLTAIGMVRAGVSGNLMSLGAIDFGLIVDGAVIIVENCLRHLAERQHALGRLLTTRERLHEVWAATREMIQPSVFGQGIIITVYLPILALTGVEGKMFTPMAMTVIFALVAAFVLSLTFVPAMVALCVRGRVKEQDNVLVRVAKWAYAPVLRLALRLRFVVVPLAVAAFGGAVLLFGTLGQEFVPTLDEQDLAMQAGRIPSTALTQSLLMQFQVEKTLSAFPEVAFVFSKTGTAEMASDPMPPNLSDTFIILKPRAQWPNPSEPKSGLVQRMEEALEQLPGNVYEFTQPIQLRFNELISGVRSDVAVKVYGDDFDAMRTTAAAIGEVLQGVPGAADVKVEHTTGLPILSVITDRAAMARYGLNVADVQDVVAIAMGGREAGLVFEGDRRFPLMVRLPEALRQNLDALATLRLPLPPQEHGHQPLRTATLRPAAATADRPAYIPLGEVARFELAEGPNQISRENGKRRIVVQVNIRGRDLGSFVADAQQQIAAQVPLPAGSWLDWGGQFENLVAARQRLSLVVPLCFFLIFLLLFSAFNSVKYAALVFTGVPLALTGGIVSLWLRAMPFSISAAVGFIALSGVAVLNGLVMVTYINQLRLRGALRDEAIMQGAMTRLRPVLMTALVASLGFVPMALATGTGAEVQKPLATVVIGGLVSSTLLTLVVLPALYRIFAREHDLTESHAEDITQEPQVATRTVSQPTS
jgi:cobalt-zinc-cadmium resistance protein CzcA